jgi:hypothetical protein
MFTWLTVYIAPRSYWIQAPSPLPDQRVDRLLSTVLPGTFPSFVFAVTPEADGVISTTPGCVGVVGVGVGVALGGAVGVGVGVGTAAPPKLTSMHV